MTVADTGFMAAMLVVFPVAVSAMAGSENREQISMDLRDCTDVEAGQDAAVLVLLHRGARTVRAVLDRLREGRPQ